MKNKPKKKKDLSVLLPVIVVVLILAFIVGGLIYNALTSGPEPLAEDYFVWMMEQGGASIFNSYHPKTLAYAAENAGCSESAIFQRVQSRIETWYDSKILSVCGKVLSYEVEITEIEDAEDSVLEELAGIVGRSVSKAVTCTGLITVEGEQGDTTSQQNVYLMKIDDVWYFYGLGLLV